MAGKLEIEIGVWAKQCLDRRIASIELLATEVGTCPAARNEAQATIDWLFDGEKARSKLGAQLSAQHMCARGCRAD